MGWFVDLNLNTNKWETYPDSVSVGDFKLYDDGFGGNGGHDISCPYKWAFNLCEIILSISFFGRAQLALRLVVLIIIASEFQRWDRQLNNEGCTFAFGTREFNCAAMRFDSAFNNGHSDTCALNLPNVCRPPEGLKQLTLMFLRYSNPMIFYTQRYRRIGAVQMDMYNAIRVGIFDRVRR